MTEKTVFESFALINDKDQVVNHILVDKDASNFEEIMAVQLEHWGCVRYVETFDDEHLIILDPSPEIWTTHEEGKGFVLPNGQWTDAETGETFIPETKKISELPEDSLLLEKNKANRPEGWVFPPHITLVEG
jgi:hypothetical protein